MVASIQNAHECAASSYRRLLPATGVAYSSFMRWQGRVRRREAPIRSPGPKKSLPLDLAALQRDVTALDHGARRSAGSGLLYQQYRDRISRRSLRRCVRQARRDLHRKQRDAQRRILWLAPGLVWAMDDSDLRELQLHQVQDLASRYKLEPLLDAQMPGCAVAADLREKFERHGPPLFLKTDNGSNLTAEAVLDVLAAYGVIPLASPAHYPPYNGGIERAAREIKEAIYSPFPEKCLRAPGLIVHELNHRPRGCLGGKTPCEVFGQRRSIMSVYTARKRQEVYGWITQRQRAILTAMKAAGRERPAAAWRRACEEWLRQNGAIAVLPERASVTHFPQNSVS